MVRALASACLAVVACSQLAGCFFAAGAAAGAGTAAAVEENDKSNKKPDTVGAQPPAASTSGQQ